MSQLMLAALDPMGVVMTVIGLGALIFFHELGHFIACRLTGTRVEVFSIGFGPKLFGWRRNSTFYKVAAIPLGGYVKMAAENPGEENTGAPDEFPNKSFAQRLFIMSNGVVFNVLLALVFYVVAFGIGVPFPRAEVGSTRPGEAGWEAGLRPGDLVTHVNGKTILGFDDLRLEIAFTSADEVLDLTVQREGRTLRIPLRPSYSEAAGMPTVGVEQSYHPAMQVVVRGSPIEKAGGRVGDVVLAVNGMPLHAPAEFGQFINRAAGRAGPEAREIAFRLDVKRKEGGHETLDVRLPLSERPQLGIVPHQGRVVRRMAAGSPVDGLIRVGDEIVAVNGRPQRDLATLQFDGMRGTAVESVEVLRDGERHVLRPTAPLSEWDLAYSVYGATDMQTTRIAPRDGMPAIRAGLQAGDVILQVGETKVTTWVEMQEAVLAAGVQPLDLVVRRAKDETVSVRLTPARNAEEPGYGAGPVLLTHREENLMGILKTGWDRTVVSMKAVVLTIRSLFTRRVSARHIGGPVALAQATYQMLELGWARYLYILALISINLAILNILPIPVLDGGQIVLLCAEKLRGKPLPERVVGYLQLTGLFLILSLLALAFYNDFTRLFG